MGVRNNLAELTYMHYSGNKKTGVEWYDALVK